MIASFLRSHRVLLDDSGVPRSVWVKYDGWITTSRPSEAVVMQALAKPFEHPAITEDQPGFAWRDFLVIPVCLLIFVGFFAWIIGWWVKVGAGGGAVLGLPGPWGFVVAVAIGLSLVTVGVWVKNRIRAARSVVLADRGRRSIENAWLIRIAIRDTNRCPCCGFDLARLPPSDDGVTHCAECAAAWRVAAWMNDGGKYALPFDSDERIRTAGSRQRRPAWTLDARARLVPMLGAVEPSKRVREIKGRGELGLADALPAIGLTVGICLAGLAAVVAAYRFDPFGAAVIGFALTPFLAFVCYRLRYAGLDRCMVRLRHALLAERRCPCCESMLRAEPVSTDGCLVCDACGSAWNPPSST